MKIVIDLTALYHNFTGVERYAKELTLGMLKLYKEEQYVLLFKNEIATAFEGFKTCDNVEIKVLNGKNKLVFNQAILPFALYGIKADAFVFLAFPEPWLFFNKNIITAVHDMSPWDLGKNMPVSSRAYYRLSNIHTFLKAKKILTISRFSGRRILSFVKNKIPFAYDKIRKRMRLVYCGVDSRFSELIADEKIELVRKKYNLPAEYILSLGTVEPRKNLKLLIKAYGAACMEADLPKLVIAGRFGWKEQEAIGVIPEASRDNIVFSGFIDDEDLPALYSGSSLFVYPSMYEGFGLPPLEAMMTGTPVLSSDAASLKEVLGEGARYFKNGDVQELSEKLKEINYIRKIPKDSDFTWERAVHRLHSVLKEK